MKTAVAGSTSLLQTVVEETQSPSCEEAPSSAPHTIHGAGVRITCPSCGSRQEALDRGRRCVICSKPLFGARPEPDAGVVAPPALTTFALPELEPRQSLLPDVACVLENEKRLTSWLSLVPIWGVFQLRRSQHHTAQEKLALYIAAAALSSSLILAVWSVTPGSHQRAIALHAQVESRIEVLGGLVEQYRKQSGTLPDAKAWQQSVQSGDMRFYDPWRLPYRYEASGKEFSIGTLGRNGVAGGNGEDADFVREFSPAPAVSTPLGPNDAAEHP